MRTNTASMLGVVGSALLWGATALATTTPEAKCQAGKNQESGKYAFCLHKAEAKLVKTKGSCSLTTLTDCYRDDDCPVLETCQKDTTSYGEAVTKCETKYAAKWTSLEQKAAEDFATCPDGLLQADVKQTIDACVTNVAAGLAGQGLSSCAGCGDGDIAGSEDCDQGNLNGGTCAGEGFAGGTIACGANCVYDTSGCYAARFVDNGDGTISDHENGLMWAKKSNDGSTHDQDNLYTLSVVSPNPDGTAYTTFLATLNGGGGFAGHTDWRLPTREELVGIVDYADATSPTVNAVFDTACAGPCSVTACSCTSPAFYWSSSTVSTDTNGSWLVWFGYGYVDYALKTGGNHVRAVRTGS